MGGGKQTTNEIRSAIIALFNSGKFWGTIANQLNLAKSTVQNGFLNIRKMGSRVLVLSRSRGSARPRFLGLPDRFLCVGVPEHPFF